MQRLPPSSNSFANIGRLGSGVSAGWQGAGGGNAVHHKTWPRIYTRIIKEAESAGGDRRRRSNARKTGRRILSPKPSINSSAPRISWTPQRHTHRGVLTGEDMAKFKPRVEAPVTYDYGRYTVCKPGA